jgi:hypothetical protein
MKYCELRRLSVSLARSVLLIRFHSATPNSASPAFATYKYISNFIGLPQHYVINICKNAISGKKFIPKKSQGRPTKLSLAQINYLLDNKTLKQ